jgi:hypothetical protein
MKSASTAGGSATREDELRHDHQHLNRRRVNSRRRMVNVDEIVTWMLFLTAFIVVMLIFTYNSSTR